MSPRKKYTTLKNKTVDESEIIQDLDLSTPQHWTPLGRGTGQHVYRGSITEQGVYFPYNTKWNPVEHLGKVEGIGYQYKLESYPYTSFGGFEEMVFGDSTQWKSGEIVGMVENIWVVSSLIYKHLEKRNSSPHNRYPPFGSIGIPLESMQSCITKISMVSHLLGQHLSLKNWGSPIIL